MFILLVEAAVNKNLSTDLWGKYGYFFTENGSHVWGDVAHKMAKVANEKGYIPSPEIQVLSKQEADEIAGFQVVSHGLNSKGKARRARKFLGWVPKERLDDEISTIIDSEARLLGITVGHAKKAAGRA